MPPMGLSFPSSFVAVTGVTGEGQPEKNEEKGRPCPSVYLSVQRPGELAGVALGPAKLTE